MSYPVQVVLDQGNLAIRLREIREWLSKPHIPPGAFDDRMRSDFVQLRVDFMTLSDRLRALAERDPDHAREVRRYADDLNRAARDLRARDARAP